MVLTHATTDMTFNISLSSKVTQATLLLTIIGVPSAAIAVAGLWISGMSASSRQNQPPMPDSTPTITSVSPITAFNRQTIIITGSGFGNTPPQLQPVGDGSVDTYACSVSTPSIAVRDNSGGTHNWAAGRETCSNFDAIGIYLRSWSDTKIVLGGLGTALSTNGQGSWNIAVGDSVAIALFGPNNATEVDYALTVSTITETFHTLPAVGAIVFNYTTYTNGQSGSFAYNNYTAIAIVPSGYAFTGWSTGGSISVTLASGNPTTAAVTGSGSLTANFKSSTPTPITPEQILLPVAVTVVAGYSFRLRRRGPTKRPSLRTSNLRSGRY